MGPPATAICDADPAPRVTVRACASAGEARLITQLCASCFPDEVQAQGLSAPQWVGLESDELGAHPEFWPSLGGRVGGVVGVEGEHQGGERPPPRPTRRPTCRPPADRAGLALEGKALLGAVVLTFAHERDASISWLEFSRRVGCWPTLLNDGCR